MIIIVKIIRALMLFIPHLFLTASTADIELTSSQDDTGVCIGERVIFTCTVTGIGRVDWAVESLNTFREDIIRFRIHEDEPGSVLVPDPFPEVVNVTLISADQSPLHPELGNVSSQITVLVTSLTLDKHVYCGNGRLREDEVPSIVIMRRLPPSSPSLSNRLDIHYGIGEYSVKLNLPLSSDDGEVDFSSYTIITLSEDDTANDTIHHLSYNTNHSFNITVVNCFGEQNSTLLSISEAGCDPPVYPANGTIKEYTSTEEGVWIQFHCCEGYSPFNNDQKMVSSQCLNSSWLPDPQTLVCEPIAEDAIDCGTPLFNGDVINFTSTTLGSIATYQCRDDLSNIHIARCTSDGVWWPEPNITCAMTCVELSGTNTTILQYSDTVEGSLLTISCLKGYYLPGGDIMSVCTNGSWSPNPLNTMCLRTDTGLPTETIVFITVAVVIIILACSICLLLFMCWRQAMRLSRKRLPRDNCYMDTEMTATFTTHYHTDEQPEGRLDSNEALPAHREPENMKTEFMGEYSLLQSPEPEQRSECHRDYEDVQLKKEQHALGALKPEFIGEYSVLQLAQSDGGDPETTESSPPPPPLLPPLVLPGELGDGAVQDGEESPPPPLPPPLLPPHSPINPPAKNLIYAELDHKKSPSVPFPPPRPHNERVNYEEVIPGAVGTPLLKDSRHKADHETTEDIILIQLEEMYSHWRKMARALGLENMIGAIEKHYGCNDREAMAQVIHEWVLKTDPVMPTWNDVADLIQYIGHFNLANSLRQVYVTGKLPIEVSEDVPKATTDLEKIRLLYNNDKKTHPAPIPPPPVPPRHGKEMYPPENEPSLPLPSVPSAPPPLPPREEDQPPDNELSPPIPSNLTNKLL